MDSDRDEHYSRPAKRRRRDSDSPNSEHRSGYKKHGEDIEKYSEERHREPRSASGRHHTRRSRSPVDDRNKEDEREHRQRKRQSRNDSPRRSSKYWPRSRSRSRERRKEKYHERERDTQKYKRDDKRRHHDHEHSREREERTRELEKRSRRSPQAHERSKKPLPSQQDAFTSDAVDKPVVQDKQKPNFSVTGKLAAASNTIQTAGQTIVLKYHEPSEARKPATRDAWRLYVFKNETIIETVELAQQSCWLFGRETAVADFPVDHPSCSKQHCVIQFRYIEKRNEFGDRIGKVKPYVIDLESANGTSVNDETVPPAKYVELRDGDVIKLGHSSREYMIQLPPP